MASQMVQEVCCGVGQLSNRLVEVVVRPEGSYHGFPTFFLKEARTRTSVLT